SCLEAQGALHRSFVTLCRPLSQLLLAVPSLAVLLLLRRRFGFDDPNRDSSSNTAKEGTTS
ncbi:MAG: hypothetical protein AAGG44_11855, partial [Planctomycetota bacterium]